MIPKVIHYCWFGNNRKSKLIKDCISSWKKFLPDYEIIEWNESNTDLSHPFLIEAYKQKKWAFVSDWIRLKILYEYGGVYLDTDMMMVKKIDDLLNFRCFFGAEDLEFISCGIIGAEKKNDFIKKCFDFYFESNFFDGDSIKMNTIPRIVTKIFKEEYSFFGSFGDLIVDNDLAIFPSVFFYPFPFDESKSNSKYKEFIKEESFTVHLWNSSWIEYTEFYYLRKKEYRKGLSIVMKNIFLEKKVNLKYLIKIASCFKESVCYEK